MLRNLRKISGKTFGISSLAFDSTEQTLSAPLTNFAKKKRKRKRLTFKVLVSSETFSFGLKEATRFMTASRRLVRLPISMFGSTCENYFQGLFQMQAFREHAETQAEFRKDGHVFAHHFDRDGDATSDSITRAFVRYKKAVAANEGSTVLFNDMTCGNHRTQLVDTCVVGEVGLDKTLNPMYRYANLMRMGRNWLL